MPEWLPALNATLILSSGVCLVVGRVFIAHGKREAHKKAMLTAVALAVGFLVVYLTRAALFGSKQFGHEDEGIRSFYLLLLAAHTIASVVVIPPVLLALQRAKNKNFTAHKKIARVAFPLWIFVATSGWLVWWMLYHY